MKENELRENIAKANGQQKLQMKSSQSTTCTSSCRRWITNLIININLVGHTIRNIVYDLAYNLHSIQHTAYCTNPNELSFLQSFGSPIQWYFNQMQLTYTPNQMRIYLLFLVREWNCYGNVNRYIAVILILVLFFIFNWITYSRLILYIFRRWSQLNC